jgi:hypothetical protein
MTLSELANHISETTGQKVTWTDLLKSLEGHEALSKHGETISQNSQLDTEQEAILRQEFGLEGPAQVKQSDIPPVARKERPAKGRVVEDSAPTEQASDVKIGILGMSGSGKSAYLYVLGRLTERGHLGSWTISPLSDSFDRFVRERHAQLGTEFDKGWRKTEPGRHPETFVMFTLSRTGRQADSHHQVTRDKNGVAVSKWDPLRALFTETVIVESFDFPGDNLVKAFETSLTDPSAEEQILTLRKSLDGCGGFLILLDCALADPQRRESPSALEDECFIWRSVLDKLSIRDTGPHGTRIRRPIAIVLNKADLFEKDLRMEPLIAARKLATRGYAPDNSEIDVDLDPPDSYAQAQQKSRTERMAVARRFVQQRFPIIYDLTKRMHQVEFFAVSCWGKAPDQLKGPAGPIISKPVFPTAIEEPLDWLVNQLHRRRVTKRRRRRLRWLASTVAFVLVVGLLCLGLGTFGAQKVASIHKPETGAKLSVLATHNPLKWMFPKQVERTLRHIATLHEQRAADRLRQGDFTAAVVDFERALALAQNAGPDARAFASELRERAVLARIQIAKAALANSEYGTACGHLAAAVVLTNEEDSARRAELYSLYGVACLAEVKALLGQAEGDGVRKRLQTAEESLHQLGANQSSTSAFRLGAAATVADQTRMFIDQGKPDQALRLGMAIPDDWIRSTEMGREMAQVLINWFEELSRAAGRRSAWEENCGYLTRAITLAARTAPEARSNLMRKLLHERCAQYAALLRERRAAEAKHLLEVVTANLIALDASTDIRGQLPIVASEMLQRELDALVANDTFEAALSLLESIPQDWLRENTSLANRVGRMRASTLLNQGIHQLTTAGSTSAIDAAFRTLAQAITEDAEGIVLPQSLAAIYNVADGRISVGKLREASDILSRTEIFNTKSSNVRAQLEWSKVFARKAKVALLTGEPAKALTDANRSLSFDPGNHAASILRAYALTLEDMRFVTGGSSKAGFYLDATEVSYADYKTFVGNATGASSGSLRAGDPSQKRRDYSNYCPSPEHPVVFVTWYDACAYAVSNGKRLPSEWEFERAVGNNSYPWGNVFTANRCNTSEGKRNGSVPTHTDLGDNVGGVLHLAGNVREWTSSMDSRSRELFVKGASWLDNQKVAQKGYREPFNPASAYPYIGFRCAADPLPLGFDRIEKGQQTNK